MKATIFKYSILATLIVATSCLEKRDLNDIPAHPTGWMIKNSNQFHGDVVTASISGADGCQSCHGDNYTGGTSQVSCNDAQCHASYPHPEGFRDPNSPNSHVQFIRSEAKWDITTCKKCHGVDYDGAGSSDKNCLKCHRKNDGPENCTVCHGGENAAPPKDLSKNSETFHVTVGAHQAHVTGTRLTNNILGNCTVCHSAVPVFNVASHVNDGSLHSEVIFSDFGGEFSTKDAAWDRNSATCSNVYCHGAFEFAEHDSNFAFADSVIVGTYNTVSWTSVGSNEAGCGTCHGLPPEGHIASAIKECTNCHANVVDANLNIIGKSLHINGRVDH